LIRERGIHHTSRRMSIPVATLADWKYRTRALAYSSVAQVDTPTQHRLLLEQLIHEQEIEMRFEMRRKYRHNRERIGSVSLQDELRPGEGYTREQWVALDSQSYITLAQRHMIEWLDPTFDKVAA
jgi:hypothetical protein